MENIRIENLSFCYPLCKKKTLNGISLTIEAGEFVIVAGRSGSGKTTLLRHLKPALVPNGKSEGEIYFGLRKLSELSENEKARKIGFVMQNPDSQLVCEKVWQELAFGLENLGFDSDTIRLRVAETAEYFGISYLFNREVNTLSGGQKQLVNLASVMAMNPDLLILDEPVSQLDPISAAEFLENVEKINKELGITVIITEHRLEEIFALADKILILENGETVSFDTPLATGNSIRNGLDFARFLMPSPMRIYAECESDLPCPVTVRDGRKWLKNSLDEIKYSTVETPELKNNDAVLKVKDVYFKYSKDGEKVLDGIDFSLQKGRITAILGGNGSGKSTLLKLIAGVNKPLYGKIKSEKLKIAYLPQQVQAVFTQKSVKDDFRCICDDFSYIAQLTETQSLLEMHPFDLSGGEMQRAALAKVLLTNPDVLLLDEPTKGMDGEFKLKFAEIIKRITDSGCTVLMVSHDIEFCALYADICMMLFDGKIVSEKDAHSFFSGNSFYTTSAYRMSAKIFENAVTYEEVASLWRKNQTSSI